MKELSIEQKAKAYDKALERVKDFIEKQNPPAFDKDLIGTIFPELKENEDERIRKALVRFHKSTIDIDGIKGEQIVAWLKKQGKEQPTIIWHSIDDKPEEMKELFCEWESEDATWHDVAFYDEETNTFRHAKMPINVTKWVYVDELLEKQGEQKPADEPKFKVKYAGSEYNVFETKDIAGVTFYGIEDEPNHIDYVKAENCEIISVYAIKENGSPYPTKPAVFSEKKPKRMISAEAKEAMYDKPACVGRNDTLLDLLQKMPSCITLDGIVYHFVMAKPSYYIAYYKGNKEKYSGNAIFGVTAFSPIDLLNEMLEVLKEKGLLE